MLSLSRKLLAACLLVAGMSGASFAQGPNESKLVTSQDGHFHVVFPGEPSVATDADGMQTMDLVNAGGNLSYVVMFRSLSATELKAQSESGVSDSDALAAFVKTVMTSLNGTINAEREINTSGVAGKEICFARPDGTNAVSRCYLAGGRLYQLVAYWNGTAPAASDVSNFLDSFGLDN